MKELTNYYNIIFLFHTLEENGTKRIADNLSLGESYTSTRIDRYIQSKENLNVLAKSINNMINFTNLCLEDYNN